MTRIAVIVGSTRPGRVAGAVAEWVYDVAAKRRDSGTRYEILDLAEFDLPIYDEPLPAALGHYSGEHTVRWADAVRGFDGFVVVTGEYNHGPAAAVKNAFDYLYAEWNDKPVGFVGYGAVGGARAVEQLRLVAIELRLAPVAAQVALQIATDFPAYPTFAPSPGRDDELNRVLDQVETWAAALGPLREE